MLNLSATAIAAISIVAITQNAYAADIPVKAPPAPRAVAYVWSGFYIGANGGYAWGDRSGSFHAVDPVSAMLLITPPATPLPDAKHDTRGGFGGAQLGYNWQIAPRWVTGVEADISFGDIKGSGSSSNRTSILGGVPGSVVASEKIDWFGTVRGRLGYLVTDDLLIYGTGGFAYGRVKQQADYTFVADFFVALPPFGLACVANNACFSGTSSRIRTGWTAGVGAEKAFGILRFKLEYLYTNLGSNSFPMVALDGNGSAPPSVAARFNNTDFHLVRAGVNIPFGPVQ
jgi:outer membrane immunogenic protein